MKYLCLEYLAFDTSTLNFLLTAILVGTTVYYAFLTKKLVKETRLSREFHLEAHIIAYLTNSETTPDVVSLNVKNIGNGVAKNIRLNIIKDIEYVNAKKLSEIGIFEREIGVFPPNHHSKFNLMSLIDENDKKSNDYIEFEVIYDDLVNKNKSHVFKLYFKHIKGIGKLTPPDNYVGMISYRLEKIEKLLERFLKKNEQ